MADLLKGNFSPQKQVKKVEPEVDLETRYERETLKKLGGSIAFVSKKKVKWDLRDDE